MLKYVLLAGICILFIVQNTGTHKEEWSQFHTKAMMHPSIINCFTLLCKYILIPIIILCSLKKCDSPV